MKMRAVKMAELKIEAPLARTEEWSDFSEFHCSEDYENSNKETLLSPETNDNSFCDNFSDTFSTSLEDLVNTFDDKITKCFCNYDEKVDKIAPVPVRTQDELMNNCQMWWTLTGNYGNIMPIDWTKTHACKLQIPALNLNEKRYISDNGLYHMVGGEDDEEEDIAKDLDLHSLIISSLQQEPMFTAEQVLEEIDEIMQEAPLTNTDSEKSPDSVNSQKGKSILSSLMYEEKLRTLSCSQLNELYVELEQMIREHSETLIHELALRDELDFEKELKNTFISVLLSIQNRRRQNNIDRKKGRSGALNGLEPKYLTTVIPYDPEQGAPDNQALQILIKILQAINEDSPTVPTLLTDYILKVLCPT